MNPKFSIIIPVYNVEDYVGEAIQSVLSQSYTDYEMIIVDDGSTDNSSKIIDDICRTEMSKVRVIHQTNKGLSEARNVGIEIAKGDYIVLLDSDDYLHSDALKGLFSAIERNDADIIVNRIDRYDDTNSQIRECNYSFKDSEIDKNNVRLSYLRLLKKNKFVIAAWVFVVKRSFLVTHNIRFVQGLLHEDELWTHQVLMEGNKILYNNNSYLIYRVNRPGSIMYKSNDKRNDSLIYIFSKLQEYYLSEDKEQLSAKIYREKMYKIYVTEIYNLCDKIGTNSEKEVLRILKEQFDFMELEKLKKISILICLIQIFGFRNILKIIKKRKDIKRKRNEKYYFYF